MRDCALFEERIAWYCLHMSQRLQIQLYVATISRIPKIPTSRLTVPLVPVSRPSTPSWPARPLTCPVLLCNLDLWCWAGRTCTRKPRGKRLKWHRFTIFRALRAPSTATAPKKCLPESVFSGRTPKTTFASAGRTNLVAGSPFQSLLSPSCYFLSAQRLCDDVKIVAKIRWGLEEVSLYILEYGKNIAPNRVYILEYSLYSG